jgi:hypothetical protein
MRIRLIGGLAHGQCVQHMWYGGPPMIYYVMIPPDIRIEDYHNPPCAVVDAQVRYDRIAYHRIAIEDPPGVTWFVSEDIAREISRIPGTVSDARGLVQEFISAYDEAIAYRQRREPSEWRTPQGGNVYNVENAGDPQFVPPDKMGADPLLAVPKAPIWSREYQQELHAKAYRLIKTIEEITEDKGNSGN